MANTADGPKWTARSVARWKDTVPVAFSEARFQVKKSACFWRHGRYQE